MTRRARRAGAAKAAFVCAIAIAAACRQSSPERDSRAAASAQRPSILLVTLDTTRADAIGPEAIGVETPAFNALAARGLRFRQAYATVPETLPSHAAIMTGLYPAGHGVHENGRFLAAAHPVIAEQLHRRGYRTAAFVSAFVLAKRFGLARGFQVYDDGMGERSERSAPETTERALTYLAQTGNEPVFLWVHYFDPHAPYEPRGDVRKKDVRALYGGEVAAVDQQLGRLVTAFEQRAGGSAAIVVTADHGEGLGDHGEAQHGNLLYQSTMHVPLVIAGPGVAAGVNDGSVSTRRVYHTVLDWAGVDPRDSLRGSSTEVVIGEAMKPFLEYGWQPQVMAIEGGRKAIFAGALELYDVASDPGETRNLAPSASETPAMRKALDDYPAPSLQQSRSTASLTDEERRRLASLGYVGASAPPVVRKEAPRPADMVALFDVLERASALFVAKQYKPAIPLFEQILARDPFNLDAALRLAIAHSTLWQDAQAAAAFARAARIAPSSPDVPIYRALHDSRRDEWRRAVPVLERAVAETPDRTPAVEALAIVRERQGRVGDAVTLWQKVFTLREPDRIELGRLGQLAMQVQRTDLAIEAFERALATPGPPFVHDLELGVLYLSVRRFEDARIALDRVPASHPEYAMALFKRAQVSVLLKEPDRIARIDRARQRADATTRELIARERLFQNP
jgi:choline-sulfatase